MSLRWNHCCRGGTLVAVVEPLSPQWNPGRHGGTIVASVEPWSPRWNPGRHDGTIVATVEPWSQRQNFGRCRGTMELLHLSLLELSTSYPHIRNSGLINTSLLYYTFFFFAINCYYLGICLSTSRVERFLEKIGHLASCAKLFKGTEAQDFCF